MSAFTKDNLPEWFCPVPFASMIFNPEGNVSSCRELGASHELGQAGQQNWHEIWNGEKFRSWRREFLTGNLTTCGEHIRHRQCHKDSWNLKLTKLIELSEIQSRPPQRLSPDFNGRCNLECEMCRIWKKPNGFYDEIGFWEGAEKDLFPFVNQVDPLSGEPFIQKDTFRLLESMAESNPGAEWKFTTNAHWKFTSFIQERLDRVTLYLINISLDSLIPENYARIRKKGDLRLVLKTIDDLAAYCRDRRKVDQSACRVELNMLIQVHNWREMGPFVNYARERYLFPFMQFLYEPTELSILSLSLEERKEILMFYRETMSETDLRDCYRVINPLEDSIFREMYKSAAV